MSQFTPNKVSKEPISAPDNLVELTPEAKEILISYDQLLRTLSPEEETYVRRYLAKARAAAENNDIERSTKRHDLSCQYLTGSGETPAALLQQGIDAIIDEHGAAGDVCPHNSKVAAPLLCLLQSTGYGKTRALLEMAKESKNQVVYLLWKDLEGSWKVPSVLKQVLDIGDNEEEPVWERKWLKFLEAVQNTVDEIKREGKDLFKLQVTDDFELGEFYGRLSNSYGSLKKSAMRQSLSPQRRNTKEAPSIQPLQATQSTATAMEIEETLPSQTPKKVTFNYSKSKKVTKDSLVICFDEASALSKTAIRALRRSVKQRGMICILSDTAASICEFMPSNDHSSSLGGGRLGRFEAPIFALSTTDLDWKETVDDEDYEALFCAGRPRWRSHLEGCRGKGEESIEPIESLIKLASKLLTRHVGDGVDREPELQLDGRNESKLPSVSPSMIAMFAARFSLGPTSKISKMLVKHSLATVIGVSCDRDVVCSAYPSEPVLAEASARYTMECRQNLLCVLQHVRAATHNSNKLLEAPRGDAGEMCAAALLGYSMDHLRRKANHKYFSQPVPLKDLLCLFDYGEDEVSPLDCASGWQVNFTHFIRPEWVPSGVDLQVMWKRRMAYYVPDGCKGLDLLICICKEGKYATLRVQVKNYTDPLSPSARNRFLYKLLPSQCPPSVVDEAFSVSLLLSVNEVPECCRLANGHGHDNRSKKRSIPAAAAAAEENQQVLQLATCFPSNGGELTEIAGHLKNICTQNTARKVDIDPFCNDGILRCLLERLKETDVTLDI